MTAPARRRDMRPDNVYVSRLLANVPQELRVQPVWVCWKWEAPAPRKRGTASAQRPTPAKPPKPAKLTKVLYDPHSGRRAKVNDASTWGAFDDALSSYQQGGYAGLGYVLSAGAGVAVIDLDGCRDSASGALAPWALALIERLASYTEISPSGTGVHIWLCATLPDKEHSRAGAIEIYSADRFMTVTGERLPNTPAGIEERGRQLAAFYRETFAPKQQKHAPARGNVSPSPRQTCPDLLASDADILARARNDAPFQALWAGDTGAYGGDASRADFALIGRLRFYTQGDASAIDRLFRQSGMMREKWDTRHFANGETYGQGSIRRALATPYAVYGTYGARSSRYQRAAHPESTAEGASHE